MRHHALFRVTSRVNFFASLGFVAAGGGSRGAGRDVIERTAMDAFTRPGATTAIEKSRQVRPTMTRRRITARSTE
jgi:hypothetical protein